jgi:NADH:ubiquinone oxidoreductase subunit
VCLVGLDVDQGEETCGTIAHKVKTMKLDDFAESTTVLLIGAPGAGMKAYLSPAVPTDRVTVTKELLEETRTVASWQAWAHITLWKAPSRGRQISRTWPLDSMTRRSLTRSPRALRRRAVMKLMGHRKKAGRGWA